MFSPEYIQECKDNEKVLREEWEPKPGDWFYNPSQDKVHLLTRYNTWYIGAPKRFIEHNIPFFQPRQLTKMLEEKGWWFSAMDRVRRGPKPHVHVMAEHLTDEECPLLNAYGPDPATALLKAYLEVTKEE